MPEDRPEDGIEELPKGEAVVVLSAGAEIMSANLQAERMLRTKLAPGSSLPKEKIFTPESLAQAEIAMREALHAGTSRSDLKGKVRSGDSESPVVYSVFPVRGLEGETLGLLLTLRDDQDSTYKQLSLRGAAGFEYETLFDNLVEGVFTVNHRMRITSFNTRAQQLTGYESREVLGRFCWEIFQSDLCQSNCPLRTSIETGKPCVDQDVRILDKSGHRISVLVNTSVIRDQGDKVYGAVETLRPLSHIDRMERVAPKDISHKIVGQNSSLLEIMNMLSDVAQSEVSVIIEGESGTGKELVAKAIHDQSPRASGPFVAVNTSALAETLLESELFGHEKGAFTGAINSKAGRFELARGGTLFLDEIAEIKPSIQVKLLRVLEEGRFERVGGLRTITMDCRIICATNRSLEEELRKGRFRPDLYYRLRTVPLTLPPLRDRLDDLPMLVEHFLSQLRRKYGKKVRGVDPKVMSIFRKYHWPGNVRELHRVLEYAFVFVKGPLITTAHLPPLPRKKTPGGPKGKVVDLTWDDERQTIIRALKKTAGKKQEAARILGISRSSLWRKMKSHGL